MRYLLTLMLLVMSFSTLQAATFLERFNSLETDIENLQDDVAKIKRTKGSPSAAPASSLSSKEVRTLKKAIKTLTKDQAALKSKVIKLSNRPASAAPVHAATPAVAASAPSSQVLVSYDEEIDIDMDEIQEQFDELSKIISDMRKFTNGNHMKISADFRSAVDNLSYTLADGSKAGNDALLTNRLWINLKYKATEKISFTGQLAYYKTFGERAGTGGFAGYDNFDWITNTTANDDLVRIKKVYFFYANDTFIGTDIPWTFSIGRRPSTNGHLINLREDDSASSPLAHFINVEFDGISSKFDFSNLLGIEGMYIKFCLGRGQTNAAESLSATPYAKQKNTVRPDLNMIGFIFSLYNNGQYSLTTQTVVANDLIDLNSSYSGFEAVGDLSSFSANFLAEGIGEEGSSFLWSDWLGNLLDETTFFMSFAASRTNPYAGGSMLGSADSKLGTSYWAGLQLPTFSDRGRWGLEYNQGSKYWKSITYSEDTIIGSKIATRGKAYEIYWTEPFANDVMSWQLRYTYIDYKYSGSNGFFGSVTGGSYTMDEIIAFGKGAQVATNASDLRFYLRYRY